MSYIIKYLSHLNNSHVKVNFILQLVKADNSLAILKPLKFKILYYITTDDYLAFLINF